MTTTLQTTCYSVEGGKIVEGTLDDFRNLIEETTRPTGVGSKYYATTIEREIKAAVEDDETGHIIEPAVRGDVWVLAMWETYAGPEVVVEAFETEAQAETAAERTYVYDILNNEDHMIFLDRDSAEQALANLIAGNQ